MNITTANTFTDPVLIQGGNWKDVESFTTPTEKTGEAGSAWFWRIGIPAGKFTSGTAVADLY